MPASCDLLAQLDSAGLITAKQIESLFGLAPRSAYPYFSRTPLNADQLRIIFLHAPTPYRCCIQLHILNFLSSETPWFHRHLPLPSDFDTARTLAETVKDLRLAASQLEHLVTDKSLSPSDIQIPSEQLDRVINQSHFAKTALSYLSRRPPVPAPT